MKKNISINLQGMIFHIEEDGYEQLSQYLGAIKVYFSTYEGHEEIIADIEARIAEIFYAKLSPAKQVITREDVQGLIAQMGTIKDFQVMDEEEPVHAHTNDQQTSSAYTNTNYTNAGQNTYKRIYRDENRKVIGGVAAGIANYLNMDPLWIRVILVFLTAIFAIPGGFPAFLIILIYIICWIAFPKSTILPETSSKKLFRNPFDKKLGGVASGMSLYFGMDVAVIRLLFLILFLAGGGGLIIYIILWLILPEATSITDQVQMQGNPVTLAGIEESLKNNLSLKDENGQESNLARIVLFPVRLIAQVLQFLARVLGPLMNFLVVLIRVVAGALLMVIAGGLIFALFVMAATALNITDGASILDFGDIPFSMFVNSFPGFGLVSGFFAALIPCLFFLMLGLGLLLKRFYLRPAVGWSMFAIWILSIFVLVLATIDFRNDFQESGEYVTQKAFPMAPFQTVLLKARDTGSFRNGRANIEIQSYNGAEIKLIQEFRARGLTESEAINNAKMVTYRSVQQDSTLTFDYNFRYNPNAIYREQGLNLRLLLPENKQYRLSENFYRMLPSSAFDRDYDTGDYSEDYIQNHLWQVKGDRFVCLNCPPEDTTAISDDNDKNETDWEEDADLATPLLDEEEYGDNTRTYNFENFDRVEVGGAYHVKIRRGSSHAIEVRGDEDQIQNLEVNQEGNSIEFKPDRDMFRFSFRDREPLLITITTPDLSAVNLSGAVKADVAGFDSDEFHLDASGAVQTILAIHSRNLHVDLTGASEATIAGSGETININAAGACQVRASRYKANNSEVELTGASNARVYVTERLNAHVSGPSQVIYRGNPQSVERDQSGMGRIEPE